jgi:hypothetical protein
MHTVCMFIYIYTYTKPGQSSETDQYLGLGKCWATSGKDVLLQTHSQIFMDKGCIHPTPQLYLYVKPFYMTKECMSEVSVSLL